VRPPSCEAFLRWALPHLELAWPGFRRVRRQVCRRLGQRTQELRLPDLGAYRHYLEHHPDEWTVLDSFCRIPVSRFFRDREVFDCLRSEVIPCLARAVLERGTDEIRCWSAGCASGEEPYSLALLWQLGLASDFPGVSLRIVATDVDQHLLERARLARYRRSSLREVPSAWIGEAFDQLGEWNEVKPRYRAGIEFLEQDIRQTLPSGCFDLILCRNLVFTYFDVPLQRRTLSRILRVLRPGGSLVIGRKERLPEGVRGVTSWVAPLGVYRRAAGSGPGVRA
jgi:chemotaxis protein methyltransferase CheR